MCPNLNSNLFHIRPLGSPLPSHKGVGQGLLFRGWNEVQVCVGPSRLAFTSEFLSVISSLSKAQDFLEADSSADNTKLGLRNICWCQKLWDQGTSFPICRVRRSPHTVRQMVFYARALDCRDEEERKFSLHFTYQAEFPWGCISRRFAFFWFLQRHCRSK